MPQPPVGGFITERKYEMREKRKTELITLRVTPHTKQVLKDLAADAHMTLTNYLCICGLGKEIVQVDGLDEVLSELKTQGRNLNQLTTLANMGRVTLVRGDDLINGYAALCEQVRQLAEGVLNGAPAKAAHSFCGERRQSGMNELSAGQAGSE